MKYHLITLLLLFNILTFHEALGQSNALQINYEERDNNNVDFYYEKTDPGSYTIWVQFQNLRNTSFSPFPRTIKGYNGKAFTLIPRDKEIGISFSYNYTYIRGKLNPKVDKGFIYRLPFKKGVSTRVQKLGYLGKSLFGQSVPKNWISYQFSTDTDTVFALRKGIVIDIKDGYEIDTVSSYTSKKNEISIEHSDGTIATYRGFVKGEIHVKVGDKVYPNTPLGSIKHHKSGYISKLRLMLYFLSDGSLDKGKTNMQNYKSRYQFVEPLFLTSEGTTLLSNNQNYNADYNEEIITAEMTKKEKKKMLKK